MCSHGGPNENFRKLKEEDMYSSPTDPFPVWKVGNVNPHSLYGANGWVNAVL